MVRKFILLTLLAVNLQHKSNAQFFIGGGAALNAYSSGVGMFPAVQPRLGFDYKEGHMSITAGFNFCPLVQQNKFNVAYSNADGSSVTSILYTEKLSISNGFLHVAYRIGNMENALRFKIIGGASNDFIKLKYSAARNIPAGYKTESNVDNASVTGPKVDFGFGADYRSSPTDDIYFEIIGGFPANQVNGQYIYNPTVRHIGFTIGYSHYFGKREYTGQY